MSRFEIHSLPLEGLKLIERQKMGDSRGFLARMFCTEDLKPAGWKNTIQQINHTMTEKKGTVRGFHYQIPPHSEMKLVSCIAGKILDFAIDIRKGSDTFLQVYSEELSAENGKALLIPEGFAHGFQSLTDNVELLYCHSEAYMADAEAGLNPLDPSLNISWPLEICDLSERDKKHPLINEQFEGIKI